MSLYPSYFTARKCGRGRGSKNLVWEVYVDEARLTQELLKDPDVIVETYSIQNGWDFSKRPIRQEWLRKIDEDDPDEIFMAPGCHPYPNINKLTVAAHPE